MMKRPFLLLILILTGVSGKFQAQTPQDDRRFVEPYLSEVQNYAIIYTGKEEPKYPTFIKNHPYFDTDKYHEGTLSFDGITYPHVKMRLNVNEEELIVLTPDGRFNVVVPANRVDSAVIEAGCLFYYVPDDKRLLSQGYYLRIHDGKYPVLKRQTAFYNATAKDMAIEALFIKKTRFYIYKNGVYNVVGSKGSVLKLFKDKKKELKQFIKQHEINFKASPDQSMAAVTQYYESISR